MNLSDGAREHNQAPIWLTREALDHTLDLVRTWRVSRYRAHPERRRSRLDRAPHRDMRWLLKIQNDRHTIHLGCHLLQHLEDLPAHRELAQRESSDVAAGSSEARDEPAADWIVDLREDDRNGAS